MYDIIVIGAGPAGLTAALFALRSNKKVLVLEAKSYGGQIITASKVENYPGIKIISGFDFATSLYNQVKDYGCDIKYETVIRVSEDKEVITSSNNTYKAKAVIIATGATNRKLKIENEDKFIGKGISYCATCDGNFFRNKTVAVIGGGNSALEDALYLSDIASKTYLIYRGDKLKEDNIESNRVKENDNIEIILNSNVTKIIGEEKLEEIEITNSDDVKDTLKLDGLFIAVGHEPNNSIFSNVVDLDEKGYIISPDGVHTKTDGIYVAGDTRVKELRQLTTAVSDGSLAATIAIREMNK